MATPNLQPRPRAAKLTRAQQRDFLIWTVGAACIAFLPNLLQLVGVIG